MGDRYSKKRKKEQAVNANVWIIGEKGRGREKEGLHRITYSGNRWMRALQARNSCFASFAVYFQYASRIIYETFVWYRHVLCTWIVQSSCTRKIKKKLRYLILKINIDSSFVEFKVSYTHEAENIFTFLYLIYFTFKYIYMYLYLRVHIFISNKF